MTTEEIIKAGWEYANTSIDETTEIPKDFRQIKAPAVVDFMEGAKFMNKHWQEKTRWKSLEKEPPKFEGQKYEVLVRFSPGIHDIVCIVGLRSVERAIAAGYKEWKEIE